MDFRSGMKGVMTNGGLPSGKGFSSQRIMVLPIQAATMGCRRPSPSMSYMPQYSVTTTFLRERSRNCISAGVVVSWSGVPSTVESVQLTASRFL